jgi:hypothetical protein
VNLGNLLSYAPDDQGDVSQNPYPVALNVSGTPDCSQRRDSRIARAISALAETTCGAGYVVDPPFLSDALRRMNYYRWLVGLQPVTIDPTAQSNGQLCALMMAKNNNTASPDQHNSPDVHSAWPDFVCAPPGATSEAMNSNVYSGESVSGLDFLWQTTPGLRSVNVRSWRKRVSAV